MSKPKQLQFVESGRREFTAKAPFGYYQFYCLRLPVWHAKRYVDISEFDDYGTEATAWEAKFLSESEARAACQAHFDALWADMNESD